MDELQIENQYVEIGKKLKIFFDELGYTQQNIADKLGVSQAAVSSQLNGKPFGKKLAKKWGDAFGLKPNWLLTGEGEMLKNNQTMGNSNNVVGGIVTGDGNIITNNDIKEFIKTQKDYLKSLEKKDEQIDRLLSVIEKLTTK
jgi:transcriptional regulator with XRE-family HTH domain